MEGRFNFPYCSPNYNLYTFHASQAGDHGGEQIPYGSPAPRPQAQHVDLTGDRSPREHPTTSGQQERVLPSVSLKVINPDKKSDAKLYILRNIAWQHFSDPDKLRGFLMDQFRDQVSSNAVFDFGYFRGNKRIWIRDKEDLREVQKMVQSDTHSVTLWCDGKTNERQAKRTSSDLNLSDSDGENESPTHAPAKAKGKKKRTRYEEKAERIDDIVDRLKSQHGREYTIIQYRIWAETMENGQHSSYDHPPKGRFFKAQAKGTTSIVSANTEAEKNSLTPSKVATLRSTYIQQIKELHGLLEVGAITNDHFVKQRDCLLRQMDELSGN